MRERIEKPEKTEPFIDKEALTRVVEEMLAERNEKEVLTEGFFRRAFFLYNLEMGFRFKKFEDEEAEEFYKKIASEIAVIFRDKQRQYRSIKEADTAEKTGEAKPRDWYSEWEDENSERNRLSL